MKIFVSYSRKDAGDFAKYTHRYLREKGYDVFIDVKSIGIGEPWTGSIDKNISECDIFVIIVTHGALKSQNVEREVWQSQKEKKLIIPCIHKEVTHDDIKWNLQKIQGLEFSDKYQLVQRLLREGIEKYPRGKGAAPIDEYKVTAAPPIDKVNTKGAERIDKVNKDNQSKSEDIERYPHARFPEKAVINDITPLEIVIKSVRTLSQTFKNISKIKLKIDDKSREIPVQVIVECDDGFEVVGKYYATVNVPVTLEDSNPIVFNIAPIKLGIHIIYVRFYQLETFVGELKIETNILDLENKNFKSYKNPKSWQTKDKFPKNIIPAPDITIFIHEKKVTTDFEFDVLISSSDFPIREMGPIKFQFNPETKFRSLFEDIENYTGNPNIIDRKIKAKGMALYDELFPPSLKELYWKERHRIESIRIISKEPWIPWEIIKPWKRLSDGNIEEDNFLCERFSFSRWLVGKHERIKEKIKNIKVIIPNDTNLEAVVKEREWIEKFSKDKKLKVSFDSSYEQVIDTFEKKRDVDVFHFSSHGQSNPENSLLSMIELEERVQLRPEEIIGKATTFGQSSPIVIMNACQTGLQRFSLTGIQGWGTKFLEAGASVFIGTLWSVNDESAFNFIKEFYYQLPSGTSLGQSVKNARNKCKHEGDTFWLAYQLYGHPNSKINF